MRLKHIKLSGFKSFVDLTKVPFEHDMTAVCWSKWLRQVKYH